MPFRSAAKFVWSFFIIGTFALFAYWNSYQSNQLAYVVPSASNGTTATPAASQTTPTPAASNPPSQSSTASAPAVSSQSAPVSQPAPAPKPVPTPQPAPAPKPAALYKDGTYTGPSVYVYYGNVQVQATISGGKLTDVQFLDHPQDRYTSIAINDYAMPILQQEALQAQSANVNGVSGASETSGGFVQSLGAALTQAKN